jgi:hypothetical protein
MGKVKRHLEGEKSFWNYKRMHWVLCKKQQEKRRLRDFRESLREESGEQGGCNSQERLDTFPKENFCVSVLIFFLLLLEVVLYGSVQSVQQMKEGMNFEAKEARISRLF